MSGATVGTGSDDDGCECIVCMEDVRARGQGHIYQCPEGHVFCATCWQQLGGPTAPCPTCKTPLATIRNRMAEKQRDQLLKMKIKLSCAAGEGGDGEEEGAAGGRNQASGAPSRATTAAKRRARKAKAIAAGKDRDAWEVSPPWLASKSLLQCFHCSEACSSRMLAKHIRESAACRRAREALSTPWCAPKRARPLS